MMLIVESRSLSVVDDVEHLVELLVLVTRSVAVGVVETDPVAIDVVHTVEVYRYRQEPSSLLASAK